MSTTYLHKSFKSLKTVKTMLDQTFKSYVYKCEMESLINLKNKNIFLYKIRRELTFQLFFIQCKTVVYNSKINFGTFCFILAQMTLELKKRPWVPFLRDCLKMSRRILIIAGFPSSSLVRIKSSSLKDFAGREKEKVRLG